MNFDFLPEKIKKVINAKVTNAIPISIVRSSVDVDGGAGESYVVAYDDQCFVFTRSLGEREYNSFSGEFNNIAKIDLKKEGMNTLFNAEINGKEIELKFPSFDESQLKKIRDKWSNFDVSKQPPKMRITQTSKESTKTSQVKSNLPLNVMLASALMFVSSVDDDIAKEEDRYIINLFNNDFKILKPALEFYKNNTFNDLLEKLPNLDEDQKLCFLANLLELGMADGILHSSELKLIRDFTKFTNISEDEYQAIKQVLVIKNKISVLLT